VREVDFLWEVLVDDTVVQIDTSLPDADLAPVVASLAPLDLDASLAAFDQTMRESGDWFAYPR
jgi:hypothetical protein